MKPIILLLGLFLFLSCTDENSLRPEDKLKFLGSYQQEKALDVQADSDGQVYILGSTTVVPNQDEDLILIALDEKGQETSSIVWGDEWVDDEGSLWSEGTNLWVLCTQSTSGIDTDMRLLDFENASLSPVIDAFPNRERLESSAKLGRGNAGNLLCLGTTNWIEGGNSRSGIYFYKVKQDGTMVWPQGRLFQQQDQQLEALDFLILQNSSKLTTGYLILGQTDATETGLGPQNLILLLTDQNGNLADTRVFGTADIDQGVALSAIQGGGYLIASNKGGNAQIFRLDESLSVISSTELPDFTVSSLVPLPDGDYLLGGTQNIASSGLGQDMAIWKVDADGKPINGAIRFGHNQDEIGVKAIPIGDSNNYQILFIGTVDFGNENTMIAYIKTDRDGNLQ